MEGLFNFLFYSKSGIDKKTLSDDFRASLLLLD